MEKFKIQLINTYTDDIIEDNVDDLVFDNEEEAEEHACYMNSCSQFGAELMRMRDPFGYDDDLQPCEGLEYIAVEID